MVTRVATGPLRVAVTGASGFIGARLCQWLTARGHTAVAIGRRTAPDISAVCDLHDRASLRTVLTGADAVVHAAAVVPGRHGGAEVADNVTLAEAVAQALPQVGAAARWAVTALLDGIFGLVLGLILIPLVTRVAAPLIGAVAGGRDKGDGGDR